MRALFLLLAIIPLSVVGQEVRKTLESKLIAGITCEKNMNIIDGDTTIYVYIYYQNLEYTYIVDLGSIYFKDTAMAHAFARDLRSLVPFVGKEETASQNREYWSMRTYGTGIFLYNKKEKYTGLKKKNMILLAEWLETVSFH